MEKEFASSAQLITSIPGVGSITGAVIAAKIQRFEDAGKLVAFVGINPVIKERGKTRSERSI